MFPSYQNVRRLYQSGYYRRYKWKLPSSVPKLNFNRIRKKNPRKWENLNWNISQHSRAVKLDCDDLIRSVPYLVDTWITGACLIRAHCAVQVSTLIVFYDCDLPTFQLWCSITIYVSWLLAVLLIYFMANNIYYWEIFLSGYLHFYWEYLKFHTFCVNWIFLPDLYDTLEEREATIPVRSSESIKSAALVESIWS